MGQTKRVEVGVSLSAVSISYRDLGPWGSHKGKYALACSGVNVTGSQEEKVRWGEGGVFSTV